MGFWSRLWNGEGNRADEGWGAAARSPWDPRFWGLDVATSLAGVHLTWETPLKLDSVRAVLGRLSGTCSTLPLMVYERTGEDSEERRPAREHPLFRLLHRQPNKFQTAQEFRADLVDQLAYWRNAYCQIRPDPETGDPIGALEPIHPSRKVKIERVGDRRLYTFRPLPDQPQGDLIRLFDDEVWHIRLAPLHTDGLSGKPVWDESADVFGRAIAVESFGSLYFRNGGGSRGVIELPTGFKDRDARDEFLDAWHAAGSHLNQTKDKLLLNGAKYTRWQINNDEAQFLETKKEMGAAVCRLWGMPPHMAGFLDKATFSNIEQQSLEFVVYCLAPMLTAIEQAAWRDLLIGPDKDRYFVEHNVAGLLRGDFKTRWMGYSLGRQWGWISANDVRRLENMPTIGDKGDVYLSPMNMTPAGQPGADGQVDDDADPDKAPQEDDNAP